MKLDSDNDYRRDEFEFWITDEGKLPKAAERDGDGYRLMQSQLMWIGWKKSIESDELGLLS